MSFHSPSHTTENSGMLCFLECHMTGISPAITIALIVLWCFQSQFTIQSLTHNDLNIFHKFSGKSKNGPESNAENSPVCTRSTGLLTPCQSREWELFVWGSRTHRSGCTTLWSGSAAWGGQRAQSAWSTDPSTFFCPVKTNAEAG